MAAHPSFPPGTWVTAQFLTPGRRPPIKREHFSPSGGARMGRTLRMSVALLAAVTVGVIVNAVNPVIPWALLWVPGVVGAAVLAADSFRTGRAEHLPPAVRQFWRR